MRAFLKRFEQWMSAVAFAEAGEWESARQMAPLPELAGHPGWFERTFAAVALAEGGLPDEALRMLRGLDSEADAGMDFLETVGLTGVRVSYAVLKIDSRPLSQAG